MKGMAVMLRDLMGGSDKSASDYYGKTIENIIFDKEQNHLNIYFTDGAAFQLEDLGQSCCEARYMTFDDDINLLNGEILKEIRVDYTNNTSDEYDEHEMAFISIKTNRDSLVFTTHNIHNGYYGGFALNIKEL